MLNKPSTLMVTIVSTPIGNLGDMSARALKTLEEADIILCEDTRVGKKLLSQFGIHKTAHSIQSFHKFNEQQQLDGVIQKIRSGQKIALISDAGTPLIADPGSSLIQRLQNEKIPYSAAPGACSVINALVLSGFNSQYFSFVGFLDGKAAARQKKLSSLWQKPETIIFFDTPHQIMETLSMIKTLYEDQGEHPIMRRLAVIREMTKMFEEITVGSIDEIHQHYTQKQSIKGELVVILDHIDTNSIISKSTNIMDGQLDRIKQALMPIIQHHDLSNKDIQHLVKNLYPDIPRNRLYDFALSLKTSGELQQL